MSGTPHLKSHSFAHVSFPPATWAAWEYEEGEGRTSLNTFQPLRGVLEAGKNGNTQNLSSFDSNLFQENRSSNGNERKGTISSSLLFSSLLMASYTRLTGYFTGTSNPLQNFYLRPTPSPQWFSVRVFHLGGNLSRRVNVTFKMESFTCA